MKKYFIYAIVIGFMGNAMLSSASSVQLTNKSTIALQLIGE